MAVKCRPLLWAAFGRLRLGAASSPLWGAVAAGVAVLCALSELGGVSAAARAEFELAAKRARGLRLEPCMAAPGRGSSCPPLSLGRCPFSLGMCVPFASFVGAGAGDGIIVAGAWALWVWFWSATTGGAPSRPPLLPGRCPGEGGAPPCFCGVAGFAPSLARARRAGAPLLCSSVRGVGAVCASAFAVAAACSASTSAVASVKSALHLS